MTETYMPDKPCRNGHFAPRYVKGARCLECKAAKDARDYAKHTEARRAKAAAWYAANTERANLNARQYHAEKQATDPAYIAKRKAYYERTREAELARRRVIRATPKAKAEKAAKKRAKRAEYTAYENNRRAREAQAMPPWFGELDELVMIEAADLCLLRKIMTGRDWQIDHMIPILAKTACGLHWAANVQVIPRKLNAQKNNKLELTESLEWLQMIGV